MELKEKVAYIKGMMNGMNFEANTNEGRLIAAIVDALEEMAKTVTEIDEDVDELYDEIDAMNEDLEDVENYMFGDEDEDEDEETDEEDVDQNAYEIVCPNCGEVVCVNEEMLQSDDLACPNCGTKFEIDFCEGDCESCENDCGDEDGDDKENQ